MRRHYVELVLGFLGAAVAGYLLGTLPFADLATRLATGGAGDIRAMGSGNPGAVNAMTQLGTGWGLGVLAADIAKGAAACVVGRLLWDGGGANLAGAAAVTGHCFPVWTGFRGGKGVAASVGQVLASFPAYFPIHFVLGGLTLAGPWRRRAFSATAVASAAWLGAALLWWRSDWPNAWGPDPSVALALAAAASSAVILWRFARPPPATS